MHNLTTRRFSIPTRAAGVHPAHHLACHLAWVAALALLPAVPALAAATFSLTARDATLQVGVTGGIAYLGTSVGAGPLTSSSLQPATLSLQGSDRMQKADLFWSADLSATWDVRQTYSLQQDNADTVLQSSGSLRLDSYSFDCNGPVCYAGRGILFESRNFQVFTFTLDAAAAYAASGNSAKGQQVSLQRLDPNTGLWLADFQSGWNTFATYGGTPLLGEQEQRAWTLSGNLLAGTYRMANGPDVYRRFENPANNQWDAFYDWDYSLRLTNTLVAQPVPEPGALALMLAGLAALGWRASRRPR